MIGPFTTSFGDYAAGEWDVRYVEHPRVRNGEIVEGGILLRPKKVIDSSQAWFWQPEWQAGEREAAADLAAGRSRVLESSEALLASLEE